MTPIGYESMGMIMKHMEANQRFELAARCPSVRCAERSVPLHIENLRTSEDNSISINQKTYRVSLYLKPVDGVTPDCIKERIKDGRRLTDDVDRWGISRPSYRSERLPGDVTLNSYEEGPWKYQDKEYTEREIRFKEQSIRNLNQKLREEKRTQGVFSEIVRLEQEINSEKADLFPYTCRESNTDYPVENYLQLDIFDKNSRQSIETVRYTKKIHEAMKYILTRIFGGRRKSVHVKVFDIGRNNHIIRFPLGLKFSVRNLIHLESRPAIFDAMTPIIDGIKNLEISNLQLLDHSLVRNAKELTLSGQFYETENLLEVVLTRPNQKVTVQSGHHKFSSRTLCAVFEDFLNNRRNIGKCYKIAFKLSVFITDAVNILKKKLGDRVTINSASSSMILQIDSASELHVSWSQPIESIRYAYVSPWIVEMEVVATKSY